MDAILRVKDLQVNIPLASGDLRAVRGIDFEVGAGQTLGIVGESGCGKSLSSLAVMGLLPRIARVHAQQIEFEGTDLRNLSEKKMSDIRGNRMSMIFQEPMTSLNPVWNIGKQLTEVYQRHRSGSRQTARERALHLLQRVAITAPRRRLGNYPHQLSGGQRQRVMIAMALMCDPQLIIADEPTTALDVTIQAQILLMLTQIQQEMGLALILITHDLGIVARMAHRVVVMYAGKIVEYGSANDVFSNPLHPYTQGLRECIPVPGKTQPGTHLGSIAGRVPTLIGELAGCSFRNRCLFAANECHEDVAMQRLQTDRGYMCVRSVDECTKKPWKINDQSNPRHSSQKM